MHFDVTGQETILATFFVALILIFALSAYFDYRWKKAASIRSFSFNQSSNLPTERDDTADRDRTSNLYLSHADFSAVGIGTVEQEITHRRKTQQNLEED